MVAMYGRKSEKKRKTCVNPVRMMVVARDSRQQRKTFYLICTTRENEVKKKRKKYQPEIKTYNTKKRNLLKRS